MSAAPERTAWHRLPRALVRPRVLRPLAAALGVAIGGAALLLRAQGADWTPWLAEAALAYLERSPLWRPLLDAMDPARRAALPGRIGTELEAMLPALGRIGLLAAPLAAGGVLAVGGFLARCFERARAVAPVPVLREEGQRVALVLVFALGILAHLPFLGHSLNTDEASAALHALQSAWSWADTRVGWQTHMGGELLARIGSLFGRSEFAIRLPSAMLSAVGLALAYSFVRRSHGELAALLTVGLICALPLWAEQAALVRGYGVLFFAGALGLRALWQLLDGPPAEAEPSVLRALFAAHVVGFLGHFFFVFFSLACLSLLAWHAWRRRSALATLAATWILLALVPGGLLYLPGLPATLYQTQIAERVPTSVVALRFVDELGFRLDGPAGWLALAMLTALFAAGLLACAKEQRRRALPILGVSVFAPLLLRPIYYYPRFFLHLLPLLCFAVLPVAKALAPLPGRRARLAASLALLLGLWALPRPWRMPPAVDLRGGCEAVLRLAAPGAEIVVDSFLVMTSFYFEPLRPRFTSFARGVPASADLLVSSVVKGGQVEVPGFHEVERIAGRETTILIHRADRLRSGAP